MGFANFIRKLAIIIFIIAVIGAFPLAKKVSTTVTVTEYKYSADWVDKDTNKAEYMGVLIASWISSGIVCIFLYGLGEVLEYLHIINKKLFEMKQ